MDYDPPTFSPNKSSKGGNLWGKAAIAIVGVTLLGAVINTNDGDNSGNSDKPAAKTVQNLPPQTLPPASAAANKYDNYYEHVLNNSGRANTMAKADVIELGDLVCSALDEGNSIRAVVNLMSSYSSGTQDSEYFASVIFGAVTYLCPEYTADMRAFLGL